MRTNNTPRNIDLYNKPIGTFLHNDCPLKRDHLTSLGNWSRRQRYHVGGEISGRVSEIFWTRRLRGVAAVLRTSLL